MKAWYLPLFGALAGCPNWRQMQDEEICEQTALAIGHKVAECSGASDAGVDARLDFEANVTCALPENNEFGDLLPILFECVDAMSDMTCDDVTRKGLDWAEWLEVSQVCRDYLTYTPTGAGADEGIDTGTAGIR